MVQIITNSNGGGGGGAGAYTYKGTVNTYENLPSTGLKIGDVYNIINEHTTDPKFPAGANVAWTGTEWDVLGGTFDLSSYQKKLVEGAGIDIDQDTNEISVDASIVSGAAAGATAIQPNDDISELNNDAGYITGIDSTDVTDALGYTPYNGATNPNGYIDKDVNDLINYTKTSDLPDFTTYQLKSNMVTSLNSADDTHYPTAKAVKDAITGAGGGDMLKSVYDPNNKNADAFDYCNFINTPTIPTNNNQLTNGCGYTTCTGTLTASNISDAAYSSSWNGVATVAPSKNAVYDKIESVISSIPTNNNQLVNGCGYTTCTGTVVASDLTPYAKSADLAAVATSGKYCDLTGQPTIGTATLTIQKNGTTINTFGANATSNVTANITVPTDTGDLSNGAGFITGITSGDVTAALGYTPYNATNPSGYTTCTGTLTAADISDTAFGAGWDGDTTHAPSKNAIYDVLGDVETLLAAL